jgi:hypothetical protein
VTFCAAALPANTSGAARKLRVNGRCFRQNRSARNRFSWDIGVLAQLFRGRQEGRLLRFSVPGKRVASGESSWALEKATLCDRLRRTKGRLNNSDLTTLSVDRGRLPEQYGGPGTIGRKTYDAGFQSSLRRHRPRSQGLIRFHYRKHLIAVYRRWFTFLLNTMRENAHGETDPR